MNNLFSVFPTPAPDYSGVSSVLFEMDILTVFIDPHGCNGQTLFYSEPRYENFRSVPKSFSFSVKEIDAITGIDDLLITKIQNALQFVSAQAIALVRAPVSTIIATDFPSLETEIEEKLSLPTISVLTTGTVPYEDGQQKLYKALIDKFAVRKNIISDHSIHIIGATPLDGWDDTTIFDFVELLKTYTNRNVYCWEHGGNIDAIRNVSGADLLIAVSSSGIYAADYISKLYNIPFVVGYPIGKECTRQYIQSIQKYIDIDMFPNDSSTSHPRDTNHKTALIIADQVNANAIRNCLKTDYGFSRVDVATLFSLNQKYKCPGDFIFHTEEMLHSFFQSNIPYDFVIGDPIYEKLSPAESKYIRIPHPALSGILYWNDAINIFGEKGNLFFDSFL